MKAMIRGREATGIHNTVPDGRYKLSVFKLAEFGKLSKWKDHVKEFPAPLLKRAQKAWKEFADIILSKEFEKELCVPPQHFKHPVETRLSPIWNLHGPRLKHLLSCVAGYGSSSSPRRPRAAIAAGKAEEATREADRVTALAAAEAARKVAEAAAAKEAADAAKAEAKAAKAAPITAAAAPKPKPVAKVAAAPVVDAAATAAVDAQAKEAAAWISAWPHPLSLCLCLSR
jgi:hypothetical protein